jgi:hypothetical protein
MLETLKNLIVTKIMFTSEMIQNLTKRLRKPLRVPCSSPSDAQSFSFQTRVWCPLNHVRVFSYVSSSTQIQCRSSSLVCNSVLRVISFIVPIKRNQVVLGPEISTATVLTTMINATTYSRNDDSSTADSFYNIMSRFCRSVHTSRHLLFVHLETSVASQQLKIGPT